MANKKADAKKVGKDHARTGRPVSPTEDPEKHDTSASQLASQIDPKGASGATVNAKSMDAMNEKAEEQEDKEQAEEDQSIAGKIRRSGLFWVNDHSRGGGPRISISPQNDPDADQASKERSTVESLDMHAPQTGLTVRLQDGTSFSIGEGFGPDSQPADWQRVTKPDGSLLFP